VHSGLPALKDKSPEVIAVAVAADLLIRAESARRERVKDHKLASV
jgi:xanthine dehydrogenase accessory factor